MTITVVSYTSVSNWSVSTTPKTIASLAWNAGDVLVIVGGTQAADTGIGTPTNANLTFTLQASDTSGGTNDCASYVWTAIAGSSQTGQTISASRSGTTQNWGYSVWVLRPDGTGAVGVNAANLTESNLSLTVAANSAVVYGGMDWNAAGVPTKTPATG